MRKAQSKGGNKNTKAVVMAWDTEVALNKVK
jgi:hypothetical protein